MATSTYRGRIPRRKVLEIWWSVVWIAIGLAFGAGIWWFEGKGPALQYLAGSRRVASQDAPMNRLRV